MVHKRVNLATSEIAHLWKTYMAETLDRCVLQYFLKIVEDNAIRPLIQSALESSDKKIQKTTEIFNQEKFPIPVGFTDQDVNLEAPRLFTDPFILHYLFYMGKTALDAYHMAIPVSPRSDIREFFINGWNDYAQFQNHVMDALLEKGLYARIPYIPFPKQADFVKEQSFLTGWFGERRPLHAMQITQLSLNIQRNILGKELLTGFSQTVQSKDIREHMISGKQIASKLSEVFSSILKEDDLNPPVISNIGVTDSTEPPFSDKLMLNMVVATNTYAIGVYGVSLAESTRRDIFAHYTRIITETSKYNEDGINLLIKHGYLEEPPKALDREKVATT